MPLSFSSLIHFLFPPQCVHCRREGAWLCSDAEKEFATVAPLENPIVIPGVDYVLCRGSYDLPLLATIVQRLKYDYWTGLGEIFPSILRPALALSSRLPSKTIIVPIPLHWRRRLARGFNQSDLIARALTDVIGLPTKELLRRRRSTTTQASLNAQQRATNVVDAFCLRRNQPIPASVILVDDVITTGSTIQACANILRRNGVQQIIAVGLAKG